MQGPKARGRVMRGPASNSAVNLSSRGGRDSKPELKTSNTKPKTGIKGKPEPKKGMQRARGGARVHMAGGSIARGKGRRAKKVDSISGRGSDFTRGRRNKDNSTEEEGKHPAKPQTKPQKKQKPKTRKSRGLVQRPSRAQRPSPGTHRLMHLHRY